MKKREANAFNHDINDTVTFPGYPPTSNTLLGQK